MPKVAHNGIALYGGPMTTMTAGVIPEWTCGDRLRKAREVVGLSAKDFAVELGIGRNSVAKYEDGGDVPRPVLLAWAMRTGVSYEWLTTGTVPTDSGPLAQLVEQRTFNPKAAASPRLLRFSVVQAA